MSARASKFKTKNDKKRLERNSAEKIFKQKSATTGFELEPPDQRWFAINTLSWLLGVEYFTDTSILEIREQ